MVFGTKCIRTSVPVGKSNSVKQRSMLSTFSSAFPGSKSLLSIVVPLSFLHTEKTALSSSHSSVSPSNSLGSPCHFVDLVFLSIASPMVYSCGHLLSSLFASSTPAFNLKVVLVTFIFSSSSAFNERAVHPHTFHLQPRSQQRRDRHITR